MSASYLQPCVGNTNFARGNGGLDWSQRLTCPLAPSTTFACSAISLVAQLGGDGTYRFGFSIGFFASYRLHALGVKVTDLYLILLVCRRTKKKKRGIMRYCCFHETVPFFLGSPLLGFFIEGMGSPSSYA